MTKQSIKILAVDDEQDILYTLQAIGRAMGWEVQVANNGKMAVEMLRQVKPDIIVLDYHMPQQDGLMTVKAIRAINKLVPIIVLTVDERQEIADRFLDCGASDFANKPIKVADLAARIKIHLQLIQTQREIAGEAYSNKGINEATLELVRRYCQTQKEPFFAEDAAESIGLAYQTTIRYLQWLRKLREVTATDDYGKVGRPRKKFIYLK